MTITIDATGVAQLLQPFTLARLMGEALFPLLLFRAGVIREPWEAAAGQTMSFPTPGLIPPDTTERTPGITPGFKTQEYEHYQATCGSLGFPISIHMPSNWATASPLLYNKLKGLGMSAAQTMNRHIRNKLFRAYQAGHAIVESVDGPGTTLTVNSVNGFANSYDPTTNFVVPTSNASPRTYSRNGTAVAAGTSQIIAAAPSDPANPFGPGTITLSAAVGFVAGDRIDATDASVIIRPNGATSVDGINAGDVLNLDLIRAAVTSLRRDNVGPCPDGTYHVHMDPFGEAYIARDNSFQRQIETRGLDEEPYANFAIGRAAGCTFFNNNECPDAGTVTASTITSSRPTQAASARGSGDIGADIVNAGGIQIMRTIVCGAGYMYERYVNESAFMSEAGVSGKIGGMQVSNAGIEIPMDGIRIIIKAPTDAFNETVTVAWSWTGDFVPPTHRLSSRSGAAYASARVIETALST